MHTMRIGSNNCSSRRCRRLNPNAEPARDLWPAVLRRLDADAAQRHAVPWFDWALLGGLVVFAASFPATIPVFLYYL